MIFTASKNMLKIIAGFENECLRVNPLGFFRYHPIPTSLDL
jgi:hypothetical protein